MANSPYRVQIVDESGKLIWECAATSGFASPESLKPESHGRIQTVLANALQRLNMQKLRFGIGCGRNNVNLDDFGI